MKSIKSAIICLGLAAAVAFPAQINADITFGITSKAQTGMCLEYGNYLKGENGVWRFLGGKTTGNIDNRHNVAEGVIIDDLTEIRDTIGPDDYVQDGQLTPRKLGKTFIFCGTFHGQNKRFQGYDFWHSSPMRVATNGTVALYDDSGQRILAMYNPNTRVSNIMPGSSLTSGLVFAASSNSGTQSGTTGEMTKEVSVSAVNAVQDDCRRIDLDKLRKVKGMLVASTVVSSIGAVGGAVATGFNIAGAKAANNAAAAQAAEEVKPEAAQQAATQQAAGAEGTQEVAAEKPAGAENANAAESAKKFDVGGAAKTVGTITSAANIATGATSAVLSGLSAGEIDKIIEQIEKCKSAAGKL
jgi:hypothetical protein